VKAGKVLLLVFGVLVLLIAAVLIVSGGALLGVNNALTDREGFYTTNAVRLEKDSYAIVTEPINTDLRMGLIWDWSNLTTIKVECSSNDLAKQIFVGLVEESDLKAYLNDVEYDDIASWLTLSRADYRHHLGNSKPATPASETFWVESAHGAGTQTLEWEVKTGSYSLVLMNDDGTAGIDVSVALGMKVPLVAGIATGFVIAGPVLLIIGVIMVYLAARRPRTP
jgi:hypothetical protein